jgi:lia operon protein LiaF
MDERSRNTALVLIATGLYLLFGHMFGFFTVTSLVVVGLGVYKLQSGDNRTGYLLIGAGILFLALSHLSIIVAIILISFGYFLVRSHQLHKNPSYTQRQTILESIRWNREPWVLRSMSIWTVVGEMNLDLSLAIIEEPETTLVFNGIVGDIDIIVPDDIGVRIESTILLGQTKIGSEQQDGFVTRMNWQSMNFDRAEHRVVIMLSYVVGDVNVKVL